MYASPLSRDDEHELRANWDEYSEAQTFKGGNNLNGYDSSDDEDNNATGLTPKPKKKHRLQKGDEGYHVTLTNYHIVFFTLAPFAFIVSVLAFIGFALIPGRIPATIALSVLALVVGVLWCCCLCFCQLRSCLAICNANVDNLYRCSLLPCLLICICVVFSVAGPYVI